MANNSTWAPRIIPCFIVPPYIGCHSALCQTHQRKVSELHCTSTRRKSKGSKQDSAIVTQQQNRLSLWFYFSLNTLTQTWSPKHHLLILLQRSIERAHFTPLGAFTLKVSLFEIFKQCACLSRLCRHHMGSKLPLGVVAV